MVDVAVDIDVAVVVDVAVDADVAFVVDVAVDIDVAVAVDVHVPRTCCSCTCCCRERGPSATAARCPTAQLSCRPRRSAVEESAVSAAQSQRRSSSCRAVAIGAIAAQQVGAQ